jgi:DNA-binding MarR family transcriptional regulator
MAEQRSVGLLIAIARRQIKQTVGARVGSQGLSPQQFWFLVLVLEHEGDSMRELAERLHVDPPTTSRVITALVKRGLVRVEKDPQDRRRASMRLTPRGRKLAEQLQPIALEIRSAVEEGLSRHESQTLRALLGRVIANMERCAGHSAP